MDSGPELDRGAPSGNRRITMNASRPKSFRFANDVQWNTCLFAGADRLARTGDVSIRPFHPFGHTGQLTASDGAHSPVVNGSGEVLWVDDRNILHRLSGCSDVAETSPSPFRMPCTGTFRVVATLDRLWKIDGASSSVGVYDQETLTRLLTVELPGDQVIDIASDSERCVMVLVRRGNRHVVVRVGSSGRTEDLAELEQISHAEAFVYLATSKRFVVLTGKYPRLYWFSDKGGRPFFSLSVPAMRPCFSAMALGGNARDTVFLAGVEGSDFGGQGHVLLFDGDGNALGDVPLEQPDAPPTGVTATKDRLYVTGPRGLVRFDVTDVVPEGAEPLNTTIVTPVLFSPDRADGRRWLRVEAKTKLPKGSSIEIAWIANKDKPEDPPALASGDSLRVRDFISGLTSEPDTKRGSSVFQGADDSDEIPIRTFAAPLFDVRDPYVRIVITMTAASGGRLPELSELNVFYPGRTLMENLPSIYQRDGSRPNSFLRSLVGVLETTTQGLDANIGSMGSKIHPDTAPEAWLDFIARWLGLPWDDTLNLTQKRELARKASQLAKTRGTREGLETLLESLIPGTPRRFRVTDATADFGFAILAARACGGSTLPAMLAAQAVSGPELGARTVLGKMRLAGPGQLEDDGVSQLAGNIQIEVAATAAERKVWEPWLLALISEMVPLTARVELRWTTKHALRTDVLDDTLHLESAPVPRLGTDAITNLARLPEGGTGLSATGASIEATLR
jgi:phage tail-like protein